MRKFTTNSPLVQSKGEASEDILDSDELILDFIVSASAIEQHKGSISWPVTKSGL